MLRRPGTGQAGLHRATKTNEHSFGNFVPQLRAILETGSSNARSREVRTLANDDDLESYASLNGGEDWHVNDPFTQPRYKQMLAWAPGGTNDVLDVGIGSGTGGQVLRTNFPSGRIVGLDVVEHRLSPTAKIYDQTVHATGTHTGLESASFDLIVAGEIIEHVYNADVDPFLHEMFRLLRIGGRLCLTTPNPNDIKRRRRGESVLGGSHVTQHFPNATKTRLNQAGFRVRAVRGTGRVSLRLGTHLPLSIYGSYLIVGERS